MAELRVRFLRLDQAGHQEILTRCKHCRAAEQRMGYDGVLYDIPGTEFCTLDLREYCKGKKNPGCGRYEI